MPETIKRRRRPAAKQDPVATGHASNLLLASLPSGDYARILPTLTFVPLALRNFLYRSGEPIRHVFFPEDGFVSLVTPLEDGSVVEVTTVGREGMVGVSAGFDDGPISYSALVQAEMRHCARMSVRDFRSEMDRRGAFYDLVAHYSQAMVSVVMQATACNAKHTVEQRLARWLLMAQDRIGRSEFPLTQEFVAMMLGATRQTVVIVAGTLQRAGMITYRRGYLTVKDRQLLETTTCECYLATRALLDAVPERASKRKK